MLTKLENSLEIFISTIKFGDLHMDFQAIYTNFYESKVRQTKLDEDIEQLFTDYGK